MSWFFPSSYSRHPHPPQSPHGAAASFPFWDFGPYQTGHGVDNMTPEGFGPNIDGYFPFGPQGFLASRGRGPWRRRGGHHPGSWGNRGGCRHGRCYDHDFDPASADEEMRDAATPAAAGPGGERDPEKEDSHSEGTARDSPAADGEHPDPPEEIPSQPHGGHHHRGGWRGGRGRSRGGNHNHRRHRGDPPPYSDASSAYPFDLRGWMQAFANHPFAQQIREQLERAGVAGQSGSGGAGGDDDGLDEEAFVPPVDIFDGADTWTVHVALPGARKEDVGVSWDAGASSLTVSGVAYRPGDEGLLSGLVVGERKVGLFRRKVKLPPAGGQEKDQVDGQGIVARMENGILVVVVPKVEKEWTEVRKVDIE